MNKAYKDALPAHQEAVQARADTAKAAMGVALPTGASDLAGTFCEASVETGGKKG